MADRFGQTDRRAPLTWASVPEDYDVQIRALRRAHGLSQAQLATLVGAAHKAVVYQWEARKRTPSENLAVGMIRVVGARAADVEVDVGFVAPRLTVPEHPRLLPRFLQSFRCPLVGPAGLARRRRVQLLSVQEFSYGQDLDAGMLAPRGGVEASGRRFSSHGPWLVR